MCVYLYSSPPVSADAQCTTFSSQSNAKRHPSALATVELQTNYSFTRTLPSALNNFSLASCLVTIVTSTDITLSHWKLFLRLVCYVHRAQQRYTFHHNPRYRLARLTPSISRYRVGLADRPVCLHTRLLPPASCHLIVVCPVVPAHPLYIRQNMVELKSWHSFISADMFWLLFQRWHLSFTIRCLYLLLHVGM